MKHRSNQKAAEVEAGDLLLFVADKPSVVAASLGALRIEMLNAVV